MKKGQSLPEYIMTYGWMLLIVAIVSGAIFTILNNDIESDGMPEEFNYSESLDVVDRTVPGTCESLRNNTLEYRYVFECTQPARQGNYTLAAYGAVEYNQSGDNKVIVFDKK